jgi:hypothetical protein|tara:strand:+ start:71 stop:556 length:486 start_codon:yes stop_codon:yes gene_type:complete
MKATIGTISHGTLRDQDLLEAFADELERLAPGENVALVKEARELVENLDRDEPRHCPYEPSETIEQLMVKLEDEAPDYCYFGAIDGDGSDFGFWPCIELLEEEARHGEIQKVSDTSEADGTTEFVMQVSDHGNVTLYRCEFPPIALHAPLRIEFVEVWSVV